MLNKMSGLERVTYLRHRETCFKFIRKTI